MDPYRAGSIAVGVGTVIGAGAGAVVTTTVVGWLFSDVELGYGAWRDALFWGALLGGLFGYWYTDRVIDRHQR